MSNPSDNIYKKIIGRVEQGKLPLYPQLIRQKAITRYKAEKQAELKRKQAETQRKIEVESRRRARRAARARRRFYKKQETQRKKAEALKDVRTGSWVRVNPDGSISGAGEAAFSPSEAKERGYGWGTTIMKGGKFVFVPLPKQPTEAQYYGILQWKAGMGHYAHSPQVEKQIKKEIEMGGVKHGITAPSWAGGYLKEYSEAARVIKGSYQEAARSATTPSGYELKGISLAKKGRGLQFEYAGKTPIPTKAPSAPSPRELMAMPTVMTVPRRAPQGGYGRDFAVAESIPRDVTPKPVSVSVAPGRMGLLMGAEATLPFWRQRAEEIKTLPSAIRTVFELEKEKSPEYIASEIITKKGKEAWEWKPKTEREFETQMQKYTKSVAVYEQTPEGGLILPTKLTAEAETWRMQKEALTSEAERKGWVTDSKIMYPPTPAGEAWAGKYEQVVEQRGKYITPEGYIKPEYVEYTKESKAIIAQQEALTKRAEQLSDPLYMAKERTGGMRMAPVVTKAYEFGDWWGKTVMPKVEQFTELSKGVYAMQAERGMPSIFTGTMLLPKEQPIIPSLQKGMVRGVSDIPIMAAEAGYAGEYVYEHPKEATMIAPGVAAYMAKGMGKEAVTHPVEFTGRMITMMAVTGGIVKVVRPVMPKYISGVKVTDAGVATYKGIGIKGFKEPRPVIGMGKETIGEVPKVKHFTPKQYAKYLHSEGILGGVHRYRIPKSELKLLREHDAIGTVAPGVKAPFKHEIYIHPKVLTYPLRRLIKKDVYTPREVLTHELLHIQYPLKKAGIPEAGILKMGHELSMIKKPFRVEIAKGTDVYGVQRALVLGKEYPALRYLKGVREAEIPMPELGLGTKAFGKQTYTEMGIGRAIKYERMRMEGLWGKDYFLPERMAKVPGPAATPKFKALPPPKPVLWERVGPTTLAERVTALAKTKQPKPIREGGVRIEKPIIPTYTELAKGRAYQITKGYDAFQIGQYPTHLKMLGLGKGAPKTFGKGIEEMIHPFRKKVPPAYEPSMLDYQPPKGLLSEGLRLDMARARIRPTERPPSPIEKLYERITPEDIFRDFGIERRPIIGMKGVLKPIETRFLKFTPEGGLIPQPEVSIPKPKRKIEVATMPKTSFDFKVMTDEAIKIATDARVSTKTVVEQTAKEAKRARERGIEGIGKIEAFGKIKMPVSKGMGIGFPIIEGVPAYVPGRVEKEKAFGFIMPGYEAAFKPYPIEAITPKEKQREKERTAAFIMPKIQPAVELGFETTPKAEPITEFEYKPITPPPPIITIFAEPPPPPPFALSFDEGKKKPRHKKKHKRKEREWYEHHYIPTVQELMRTPKGVGAMAPEMPPLPEITVPKL